jgi:hypothetical protein
MIETSADDPILLLHSSCTGDDEATSSSNWNSTTNNRTRYTIAGTDWSKQPILCDLLFLPEHHSAEKTSSEYPSSHSSSSPHDDFLHLPKNPMNPCGISNVLALENLPERWIAGPVLLSLTSCSIFHSNDGDDEFTLSIPLHVEPIPSTFVLGFHSNQKVERNADKNAIATVKTLSEIFVEFDVREASRQANEILLRRENHTRTDAGEDKERSKREDDSKNYPDDRATSVLQDDGIEAKEEEKEDLFYQDRRPRLEDISRRLNLHESFATKDFEEQKLLLTQLNAQLNQGTRTTDLVLCICGFFSIFLMAILLWSIYQYYKTTSKSDLFTEEIRESMKTTNDTLRMAVNELNQYNPHNQKHHHLLNIRDTTDIHRQDFSSNGQEKHGQVVNKNCLFTPTQDNASRRVTHDQDFDMSLVVQGKDQLEGKTPISVTPTRGDNNSTDTPRKDVVTDESEIDEGQALDGIITCTPIQLIAEVPTSPQKEGEKKLFFLRCSSRHLGNSFLNSPVNKATDSSSLNLVKEWSDENILYPKKNEATEIPLSPCSQLAKEWNAGKTSSQCKELVPSVPLSPCSQLAKEWNEAKTIRRGNIKKRRQYLKPPLQSNTEPIVSSSSNIKCNSDYGKNLFESTVFSRVPQTSKLHSRHYQQQQTLDCTISGPPKLRSIARQNNLVDDTTIESLLTDQDAKDEKGDSVGTERKITDGMKTPPPNMITLKTPRLCYTPASEDDSFVDDYW